MTLSPNQLAAPTLKFDYSQLDKSIQMSVRNRATQIHYLANRTVDDVITMGEALADVKAKLPHGQFEDWLRIEFDMEPRRAREFMSVAARFGEERSKSADIRRFGVSVIFALAAPSVPAKAIADVLDTAKNGSNPTIKSVKETIQAAKAAEKPSVAIPPPLPAPTLYLLPARVPSSIAADEKSGRKWNPGIRVMCDGCNEAHADWIPLVGSRWSCRRCGVIRADDSMEEWEPVPKLPTNSRPTRAIDPETQRLYINGKIYSFVKRLEGEHPSFGYTGLLQLFAEWIEQERGLLHLTAPQVATAYRAALSKLVTMPVSERET